VDPVPDPVLLRKSGSVVNRTRDLWVSSQKLWLLYRRGGLRRTHKSTLISHLRFPQPGGPGPRIYITKEQGGPVVPSDTGFGFYLNWGNFRMTVSLCIGHLPGDHDQILITVGHLGFFIDKKSCINYSYIDALHPAKSKGDDRKICSKIVIKHPQTWN
jgi:hypothetical protein